MQGSRGKLARNGLMGCVPHPNQFSAELLPIFQGDEPPRLVSTYRAPGIRGILLATEGRSQSRDGLIRGGKTLQRTIALIERQATMERVAALLCHDVDHGRSGSS